MLGEVFRHGASETHLGGFPNDGSCIPRPYSRRWYASAQGEMLPAGFQTRMSRGDVFWTKPRSKRVRAAPPTQRHLDRNNHMFRLFLFVVLSFCLYCAVRLQTDCRSSAQCTIQLCSSFCPYRQVWYSHGTELSYAQGCRRRVVSFESQL